MSDADHLRDASPWHPIDNKVDLKHLGKLAEELSECVACAACCLIYGVSDDEPTPRTATRRWLQEEVADVRGNIELVAIRFDLKRRAVYQSEMTLPVVQLPIIADNDREFLAQLIKRLADCGSAVSRCIIQGVDEREPVTGKLNRDWLRETLSAAIEMTRLISVRFGLDAAAMAARAEKKMTYQRQWHALA